MVCLDCAAEVAGMCLTCFLARLAAGYRGGRVNVESDRTYQREYQRLRRENAERQKRKAENQ